MARTKSLRFHVWGVAVVFGISSMLAIGPARQAYQQHKKIQAEQTRLVALEKQNALLQERLDRLKDPEYIEKLSREELGLVRPGEISYVVVPPPPATGTVSAPKPKHRAFTARVKDWFNQLFT
ncbi:MAG: septum formation initiator family protein [Actinomycetota bacterium]|nr:septum formation initiator family protein [Actinomycetota bacterium]